MPTYNHNGLGFRLVVRDDLKQIDLERFAKAYREGERVSASEERGAICRAAVASGWVKEPAAWDVDTADPRKVAWAAERINDFYKELTEIPPE